MISPNCRPPTASRAALSQALLPGRGGAVVLVTVSVVEPVGPPVAAPLSTIGKRTPLVSRAVSRSGRRARSGFFSSMPSGSEVASISTA